MDKKDEPLIVFTTPEKPLDKFLNKYKNKIIFGAVILAILISLILVIRFHTQIKNQLLSWNNQFQEILVKRLSQLFFPYKPRTFSVVKFNPKATEKVSQGDTLEGRGIPNSTINIYLASQKDPADIKTNKQGLWVYKIPSSLKEGIQMLTVMTFDKINQLAAIKSFKLEVTRPDSLKTLFSGGFKPKVAKAQETTIGGYPKPVFAEGDWVSRMISLGIYPLVENGEIILYNRQTYEAKYGIDCTKNHCLMVPEPFSSILSEATANFYIMSNLHSILKQNGYDPIYAPAPYFPELYDLNKTMISPDPSLKQEIDPDTLSQYITQAVYAYRGNQYYWSNPDELAKFLLEKTDPIFGFNSMIKWATLPSYKVSDEERISALFGILIIADLAGRSAFEGVKFTSNTVIDFVKMRQEAGVIRQSIKAEGFVAYEPVLGRARTWAYDRSLPAPKFEPGIALERSGSFPQPQASSALYFFNRDVLPAIRSGSAYIISRSDVLKPAADSLKNAVYTFMRQTGRSFPLQNESFFDYAIANGQVYIVPEQIVRAQGAAAYNNADLIVLGADSYLGPQGLGTVYHELTHMIGVNKNLSISKHGWGYRGEREQDRVFTALYEIMTDAWADIALKRSPWDAGSKMTTGAYATGIYPDIFNALQNRVFRQNPALFADFLEFAITGESSKLVNSVLGKGDFARFISNITGPDYNKFLEYFRRAKGVDFTKFSYVGGAVAIGTAEENMFVDPSIAVDSGFILDDYEGKNENLKVTITSATGDFVPNGVLQVSVVVTQDGVLVDPSNFSQTWSVINNSNTTNITSINQVQSLTGGERCSSACEVTLPASFNNNVQTLVVLLTEKDSDQVIAIDSLSGLFSPTASLLPSPSAIISCQSKCTFSQVDSDGQTRCYEGTCISSDCGFNKNCVFKDECNNPPKQLDCPKPSPSVSSSLIPTSSPISSPSPKPIKGWACTNDTQMYTAYTDGTWEYDCTCGDGSRDCGSEIGSVCVKETNIPAGFEFDAKCVKPSPSPTATPTPEPKTVSKIYLYGQEVDLNNPYASLEYTLSGTEGIAGDFDLTGLVQYSDGTSKSFVLHFKYRPDTAAPTPDYSCDCISGRWQGAGCDSWLAGQSCGDAPMPSPIQSSAPFKTIKGWACTNDTQMYTAYTDGSWEYDCACGDGSRDCGSETGSVCVDEPNVPAGFEFDAKCIKSAPSSTPDYSCDCISGRWQGAGCDSWLAGQSCGAPAPTADPCPGKHQRDYPYTCDPACCSNDSQCPTGQSCNFGNGGCQSGLSCNPTATCQTDTNRYCFDCRRTAIVSTNSCTGLGTVTEVTDYGCNDASMCASSSSCPGPYTQCGGTAGLGGLPANHTFYITPICDDSGGIIEYRKVDLGRLENQCGN